MGQLARVGHLGRWSNITGYREPNHKQHLQSLFVDFYGHVPVSVVSFNTVIYFLSQPLIFVGHIHKMQGNLVQNSQNQQRLESASACRVELGRCRDLGLKIAQPQSLVPLASLGSAQMLVLLPGLGRLP